MPQDVPPPRQKQFFLNWVWWTLVQVKVRLSASKGTARKDEGAVKVGEVNFAVRVGNAIYVGINSSREPAPLCSCLWPKPYLCVVRLSRREHVHCFVCRSWLSRPKYSSFPRSFAGRKTNSSVCISKLYKKKWLCTKIMPRGPNGQNFFAGAHKLERSFF